jgi:ribosome-binding factor A
MLKTISSISIYDVKVPLDLVHARCYLTRQTPTKKSERGGLHN